MGSLSALEAAVIVSSRDVLSPHHDIVVEWQDQNDALIPIEGSVTRSTLSEHSRIVRLRGANELY